jgi:hypothetical protein
MLLTTGFLADFKTGYLQIAKIEPRCEVMGGTDNGAGGVATAAVTTGFAAGRLVKLVRLADGTCYIIPAGSIETTPGTPDYPVTATSIGDATHIIAQTDDSLITTTIRGEVLNFMPTGLLKNTKTGTVPTAATATMKKVALWPIVNADDVKIIEVKPSTVSTIR